MRVRACAREREREAERREQSRVLDKRGCVAERKRGMKERRERRERECVCATWEEMYSSVRIPCVWGGCWEDQVVFPPLVN